MTDEKGLLPPAWTRIPTARRAVACWRLPRDVSMRKVDFGENATYRLSGRTGDFALRLYRPGRWTDGEIGQEHDLMRRLGTELGVLPPVAGRNGRSLQVLDCGTRAALFPWVPGRLCCRRPSRRRFRRVGELLGRMHGKLFAGASRDSSRRWDVEGLLHGPFRSALALWPTAGRPEALLRDTEERIRGLAADWARMGPAETLLHADLHLGNVKWTSRGAHPIDFDDCGVTTAAYDLAVPAYSFARLDDPDAGLAELLEGHGRHAPHGVSPEELRLFVVARGVWLLGWIAERPELFEGDRMERALLHHLERIRGLDEHRLRRARLERRAGARG